MIPLTGDDTEQYYSTTISSGTHTLTGYGSSGAYIKLLGSNGTIRTVDKRIGNYVDIGNNIIGTSSTSDDWRIFNIDDENGIVELILADYLPTTSSYIQENIDSSYIKDFYRVRGDKVYTFSNFSNLKNTIDGTELRNNIEVRYGPNINEWRDSIEKYYKNNRNLYDLYFPRNVTIIMNQDGALRWYAYDTGVYFDDNRGYADKIYAGVRPVLILPSSCVIYFGNDGLYHLALR